MPRRAGGALATGCDLERGADGQGKFAAVADSNGPGTRILYRDVQLDGGFREVVVECRWVPLDEADALVPWYRGGVRALLEGRVCYYVDHA